MNTNSNCNAPNGMLNHIWCFKLDSKTLLSKVTTCSVKIYLKHPGGWHNSTLQQGSKNKRGPVRGQKCRYFAECVPGLDSLTPSLPWLLQLLVLKSYKGAGTFTLSCIYQPVTFIGSVCAEMWTAIMEGIQRNCKTRPLSWENAHERNEQMPRITHQKCMNGGKSLGTQLMRGTLSGGMERSGSRQSAEPFEADFEARFEGWARVWWNGGRGCIPHRLVHVVVCGYNLWLLIQCLLSS